MPDDITKRLRALDLEIGQEAANEIERLRAQLVRSANLYAQLTERAVGLIQENSECSSVSNAGGSDTIM